jgi:hypothetical protein
MPPKTRSRSGGTEEKQPVFESSGSSSSDNGLSMQEGETNLSDTDEVEMTGAAIEQHQKQHDQYAATGTFQSEHEAQAEVYIDNCRKYEVPVDPGCVSACQPPVYELISFVLVFAHLILPSPLLSLLFSSLFRIVIGLRTGWNRLQPSRHIFSEGSMLPLLGVLDQNTSITHLNLSDSVTNITHSNGNGNSNARALSFILRRNTAIKELNLSNSGLDDVGLNEISAALKDNKFLEK